jgi:uncharacterized protein Yka (UPF0111/DUF47 family)
MPGIPCFACTPRAKCIVLPGTEIRIPVPDLPAISLLIHQSATEIESAVKGNRSNRDPRSSEERCIEVNRLENLADDELARAVTELFTTTDAIAIIKLKDIYEHLEIATDRCEDVANVLSDIAIRHS